MLLIPSSATGDWNMAHELDMSNGRANMVYTGETPWHRLGCVINPNASLDEWRRAAGMEWEAVEQPVFVNIDSTFVEVDKKKALVRSDTRDVLSIVSDRYKVVQPSEVIEFYAELVKENGLTMETAGCLHGGKRVWALARMDDSFTLHGRDRTDPFVMMSTSYDGTFATQAAFTSVRVVCNNTLELAGLMIEGNEDRRYRVPHYAEFNSVNARGKLGLSFAAWHAYKAVADELAHRIVSRDEALTFFHMVAGNAKQIVRNPDNGRVVSYPEPNRTVTKLIEAFTASPGANLPSAKGTAWGLLQAATYVTDFQMASHDQNSRLASATFGGGRNRKVEALRLVQELIAA